jgi:sulfur-oxidizing protein SoxY
MRVEIVDRRDVLIGASAWAALSLALTAPGLAQDRPQTLDEALKKIMGDAKPADGKIVLELPEIAENGNTVPFTLSVDSPMTDSNYVKALHIFAGSNPQVDVASFTFTPQSGKAAASSRMRLAKTQEVVAVADLSDGKFLLGKRTVKVTIGGCGG